MDQEELLQMLQMREAENASRKEINAMVFMQENKLSDMELLWISMKYDLQKERPTIVKLPNGDERKLNWECIK